MNLQITNNLLLKISETPVGVIGGDRFSIRKASAIYSYDKYWVFADIVPNDSQYWPNTYDTSIGLLSSANLEDWEYHGIIIPHKDGKFKFDFGGATTPDSVILNGQIFLFYAGKELPDGTGRRHILLAIGNSPEKSFKKHPKPIVESSANHIHFDDPVSTLSKEGKQIELYYRYANHKDKIYKIQKITSFDGINWSEPITVLSSDEQIRAYETAYGCRINIDNQSYVFLFTFDHFSNGEFKTGLRISADGVNFPKESCIYLDNYWNREIPPCGLQVMGLSKSKYKLEYLGIAQNIDSSRSYGIGIYPVELISYQ